MSTKFNNYGPVIFVCDECGDTLDTGETAWRDAVALMKGEGWKLRPLPGVSANYGKQKWEHYCADCTATYRSKQQEQKQQEQQQQYKQQEYPRPGKVAVVVMPKSLYRRILAYLHPDRISDPEVKLDIEEVFKLFTQIPVELIDDTKPKSKPTGDPPW